jgi:uncharacterized protein YdiU (UPF0061 family)
VKLRGRFPFAWIAAALLLAQASQGANSNIPLSNLADGQTSFRDLGSDFSVEVPVQPFDGARLALLNSRALEYLKILGLNVPDDPQELAKWFTSQLAVHVDPKGKSKRKMIATRYQDSDTKDPGEALGDGRAVLSGELQLRGAHGEIIYLDILLKGIGITPLAWSNHEDPLHKDGFQSMDEAAHSFVQSEASYQNGSLGTIDLAVIELPFLRPGNDGKMISAAITIRLGTQTRLAHLRYFVDQPKKFAQIYEYSVKRDLGLSLDTKVTAKVVDQHLKQFSERLASEAAFYYDMHAVHGSPTMGNRTTNGGGIDFGTFRYLDAHHQNYRYLFDQLQLGGKYGQTAQIKDYLTDMFLMLDLAKYRKRPSLSRQKELRLLFNQKFKEILIQRALTRLGLTPDQIEKLSERSKNQFYSAYKNLNEVEGAEVKLPDGRKVRPAFFDVRKVLSQSMSASDSDSNSKAWPEAWKEAFNNERSWRSRVTSKAASQAKDEYRSAITNLAKRLNPSKIEMSEISERAERMAKNTRDDPKENLLNWDSKYKDSKEVLESVFRKDDYVKSSAIAEKAIQRLVDSQSSTSLEQGEACIVRELEEVLSQ